jgi:hypothetical protein
MVTVHPKLCKCMPVCAYEEKLLNSLIVWFRK